MIEINLLPPELKKKEPRFRAVDLGNFNLEKIPVLTIAVSFVGLLIGIQVILFLIGIYTKNNLDYVSKRITDISPQKQEADRLKVQADKITRKVGAINELMGNAFSWSKKLNDLSDSVTPGIWLSELSYEERASEISVDDDSSSANSGRRTNSKKKVKKIFKYLIISGYASSMGEQGTALIGKFIQSLKDNRNFYSDFDSIELGSIKSAKFEAHEVMSFKITCLFREM